MTDHLVMLHGLLGSLDYVGGAVAMLVAARAPELVKGVISVEGNFTLDDAFWCRKIAVQDDAEWEREFAAMRGNPGKWLRGAGVDPSPERVGWAGKILNYQPASTVRAVAKAVVDETGGASFLAGTRRVLDSGIPLLLIAGERSQAEWHVSSWVLDRAFGREIQESAGHMMMLENPDLFCEIVKRVISKLGARDESEDNSPRFGSIPG